MAKVDLRKTVYNKDQFSRVVGGREFTTFGVEAAADEFTVQDFFQEYENLFLSIPIRGGSSSHEYLVRKSGELVGFQRTTEDIQPLLDEIASLRDQLLTLQQENIDLQIADAGDTQKLQDQFQATLEALAEPPPPFPDIILPDVNISVGSGGYVLQGDTLEASIIGTTTSTRQINVFDNDNIPDNVTLTLLGIERQPQFGTAAVVNKNGVISYRPNKNAPLGTAADSFSYKVVDANGEENVGEVTVNIKRISNKPPVVNPQVISVSIERDKEIKSQTINALSTASDPEGSDLTYIGVEDKPQYGRLEIIDPEGGILRYIPNLRAPSGIGADEFTYTVTDDLGQRSIGKVTVNISNKYLNYTVAGNDTLSLAFKITDTNSPNTGYEIITDTTINVLENDEGLGLVFNGITENPKYGSVTATDDGIVTYTPRIGTRSSGEIDLAAFITEGAGVEPIEEDSFKYKITNSSGNTSTATVTVKINVLADGEKEIEEDVNNNKGQKDQSQCDIKQAETPPQDIRGPYNGATRIECEGISFKWSDTLQEWEELTSNGNGNCSKLERPGDTVGEEVICDDNVYVWDGFNWNQKTAFD